MPKRCRAGGDLFWSEQGQEWVECSDDATFFTVAEMAALDLSQFENPDSLEWWTSQAC